MSRNILIKNATIVNEGVSKISDILIVDDIIQTIKKGINLKCDFIIDGTNQYLLPGIIDCQVHFREPGLTHKGDLYSESKAAVAGGVTSFIDMPNTIPNTLSVETLAEKYHLASQKSLANYAFFFGVNNQNIDAAISQDANSIIGVSDDGLYFNGKGNMLVENKVAFETLFKKCKSIIAIHSEAESMIEKNEKKFFEKYGDNIPIKFHPVIRSSEACYTATKKAIELAQKHNARLHILHLTTEEEINLFQNNIPLAEKRITTEVSIPHLWFCDEDYERLGTLIKCNPAIKSKNDKDALLQALIDDKIDIITTDHAPHTLAEKQQPYLQSLSGMPMVQHSLNIMLELHRQNKISLEKIVEKMCHNPAILYGIKNRGFIREGYFADLVLADINKPWQVNQQNLLYKCKWSPLSEQIFQSTITHTFVNGNLVYANGNIVSDTKGKRLKFEK